MKKIVISILFFIAFFVFFTSFGNIKSVLAIDCSTCAYGCNTAGTACRGAPGFCPQGYHYDDNVNGCVINTGGGGGTSTGKCTCTAAYGACGNYLGQSNIKYRQCTANTAGTITCTKVNGVFYDVVSCTAATVTPIQTIYKCTCTAAQSQCENYLGRQNVKHRVCSQNSAGTSNCEKVGSTYVEFVSCGVAATVTPNPTSTPKPTVTPGGPTVTPGGPTPTPAGCQYCSTGACNQCSNFASGWRCKCEGFNGSVYNSCKGELDTTCGVAQPTPTGIPAGLCGYCTTSPCNQCSTYASGWRCKCTGQVGNYYTTCAGELDTTCGVAQATPTPPCGKKILGDADCDNNVTLKDYFYYVAKKAGVTLPATVNVDFNASATVDDADRAIVVKTLKP